MARSRTRFPFPPLPKGEVTPWTGPGDPQRLRERDQRIICWFVEEREGRRMKASPLGDLLAAYDQVDLKGPSKSIESIEPETARFLLHIGAHVMRLAWAIRALYGHESVDRVDGSFVTDELLAEDSKERDIARKLPGGIGTLVFAARLVQAGGAPGSHQREGCSWSRHPFGYRRWRHHVGRAEGPLL